jgi:hypothetical protein
MRVLLSDGSGLTARQTVTQLAAGGHTAELLTPDRLALARFTRHAARAHSVPRYGPEPLGWLDAALGVLRGGRFDVLLPASWRWFAGGAVAGYALTPQGWREILSA